MNQRGLVFLAIVALTTPPAARADDAQPRSATDSRADGLDLIVVARARLARVRVQITIDGESVPTVWDGTFAALFRAADRNGDGSLDDSEAGRLPGAFALRQGPPFLNPGIAPTLTELDANRDGRANRDELTDFYRRQGLGGALVGVGRPPSTAALTKALLQQLDTNKDGRLDAEESRAGVSALFALDRDDDELVSPAELVQHLPYPGSTGAEYLAAPSVEHEPTAAEAASPLIPLPLRQADRHWAGLLRNRRDRNDDRCLDAAEAGLPAPVFDRLDRSGDHSLTADELAAWRSLPPDSVWNIPLDKPATVDPFDCAIDGLRLCLRTAEGGLMERVEAAKRRLQTRFAEADGNRDHHVEDREAVAPTLTELRRVLPHADRDGDGKLSANELEAWLALQHQIARGHVTLTVLDHGAGLFELLDADRDGVLSVRETRSAWDRLRACGALTADGWLDHAALPRHLIITASRGRAQTSPRPRRTGAAWFLAMDRNGDGDVSRREFNGPASVFETLDLDRDGLLSVEESRKAPPDRRAKQVAP